MKYIPQEKIREAIRRFVHGALQSRGRIFVRLFFVQALHPRCAAMFRSVKAIFRKNRNRRRRLRRAYLKNGIRARDGRRFGFSFREALETISGKA